LADLLTQAFEHQGIDFETARGSFGRGIFRDRSSARVGLVGAEYLGADSDPEIVVYITGRAAKLGYDPREFADRLRELIAHELVHKLQTQRSRRGTIGASASSEQGYYQDPHEVAAIASEIESQLTRIQPDRPELLRMLRRGDVRLEQSDRYRLYLRAYREDPQRWGLAFRRMMKELVFRLTR
jgi:hypothetical protein